MSSPQLPEGNPAEEGAVQPEANEQGGRAEEELSAEEQQTYGRMMATLSQMHSKIAQVKQRIQHDPIDGKKQKTDQMTDRLIQSKEASEIITKENLLADVTESYEKAVIEVYSENSKLKRKLEEMAKLLKEQNAKIYEHTRREKDLLAENEQLRADLARLKDEKMVLARGYVAPQPAQSQREEKRKPSQPAQNEDFDFWSMPQNEYGKKKKDFVQDSNLWVNQKEHEAVFLTEEQPTVPRRKK